MRAALAAFLTSVLILIAGIGMGVICLPLAALLYSGVVK
jgi:hypothetical protein